MEHVQGAACRSLRVSVAEGEGEAKLHFSQQEAVVAFGVELFPPCLDFP